MQVFQPDVAGNDHPQTRRTQCFAAHAPILPILKKAQQHDLCMRRQSFYLVEKQGAAVGLLNQAAAIAACIGESAALVAEQLALDQLVRKRAAIDGNKRTAGPGAAVMQGPRHELLASPRVAIDGDRGVINRDAPNQRANGNQCRRFANDLVRQKVVAIGVSGVIH
jgi:hypothetical protein